VIVIAPARTATKAKTDKTRWVAENEGDEVAEEEEGEVEEVDAVA
jgi:hypothetical protein